LGDTADLATEPLDSVVGIRCGVQIDERVLFQPGELSIVEVPVDLKMKTASAV
jgi:hypothetical protein